MSKSQKLYEKVEVVFEDKDVIVIEKASGVISYPVEGHSRDSAIQLIRRYWRSRESRETHLYLIHRLDKDTSGLMIFAKSSLARQSLQSQFEHHSVVRSYLAITARIPQTTRGEIKTFLARNAGGRRSVGSRGKFALTTFQVIREGSQKQRALIRCCLSTGRTHQIRIHLSHIGAPLIGDALYGIAGNSRLALHADTLGFVHPRNGSPMVFRSSLPAELRRLL